MIDPQNVTYYSDQGDIHCFYLCWTSDKQTLSVKNIFVGVINSVDPSWPSAVDWVHQVPEGFRKLLNYIYNNFGQPEIVVTENGWAQNVTNAGIEDQNRINYIQVNINQLT